MTLHILTSASPQKLHQAKSFLQPNDALFFAADGCYQLAAIDALSIADVSLYARQIDLEQRGLNLSAHTKVHIIGDEEWVNLTLAHSPITSWHD